MWTNHYVQKYYMFWLLWDTGGLASLHNSYTQQSHMKHYKGNYNAEKILFNELNIAVGYPD